MSRELPIFPLPLVLFPGTTQPLHVFEPRYRRLLADCLAGDKRFGIAYHRAAAGEGGEGGGGATGGAPGPGARKWKAARWGKRGAFGGARAIKKKNRCGGSLGPVSGQSAGYATRL